MTRTLESAAQAGLRRDDPRPSTADQRDQEHDRPEPQPGRADGGQRRDPGFGRRPDQAGDARRRRADQRPGLRPGCSLQIHDELVFEAPDEEVAALAALVREAMVGALAFDVPIQVEVAAGPNWLDVVPLP